MLLFSAYADTSKRGQPLYKGQGLCPYAHNVDTFLPVNEDNLFTKEKPSMYDPLVRITIEVVSCICSLNNSKRAQGQPALIVCFQ